MNQLQEVKKIAVVGLGYVGLPLAVAFAKKYDVVGFDIKPKRIQELQKGIDSTREVLPDDLTHSSIEYTSEPIVLKSCQFIIIAVPTPVTNSNIPDLTPLLKATELVGTQLQSGQTVVYESTVYPGATEEDCVPILEKKSGLKCGIDFKVGYSPERINPGDRKHTLEKIVKVVSGIDSETLEQIASVYGSIIMAGIFRATSIKVAEAAKVIENTQRDLNIALMNELSLIFDKMNIRTSDVLAAAATKWNFLKFFPGMVGGHCIGVDPYYLTHKALALKYHPEVILSGRRINDSMGKTIAEKTIQQLIRARKSVYDSRILVMGMTFKENVPDVRNTKVIDLIESLKQWECHVDTYDPVADADEVALEYGINLLESPLEHNYDAVVLAVSHQCFLENGANGINKYLHEPPIQNVLIDVKSCFHPRDFSTNTLYWSL